MNCWRYRKIAGLLAFQHEREASRTPDADTVEVESRFISSIRDVTVVRAQPDTMCFADT